MDVMVLVNQLDDLIHNAKRVPLSSHVRVDPDEVYELLDQLRGAGEGGPEPDRSR
jgi:hypothetical protein